MKTNNLSKIELAGINSATQARRVLMTYLELSADSLECVLALLKHFPATRNEKSLEQARQIRAVIDLMEEKYNDQSKQLKRAERTK